MYRLLLAAMLVAMMVGTALAADKAVPGGDCCADLEERVASLEATTAKKGNAKVTVTIYGEASRALLFTKDSHASIDNPNKPSFVGFKGTAKAGDLTFGYVLEFSPIETGSELRHAAVYVGTQFGTFWLGKTSEATDELLQMTLGNVNVVAIDATGMGGTRANVLRWDSPAFMGANVSASLNFDTDDVAVALRHAAKFGDVKLAWGIAWTHFDTGLAGNRIAGIVAAKHEPTGIFADVAAGYDDLARTVHLHAGWEGKLIELGATTFYVEYARATEGLLAPSWGALVGGKELWGLGVVQRIEAANVDAFLGFRSVDDSAAVLAGFRIKF